MKKKSIICVITLCLFTVVVISGCIFTQTTNQIPSQHSGTESLSDHDTSSPVNESYWIQSNPVNNVTLYGVVNISGITNLPIEEKILVNIRPTCLTCQKNENGDFPSETKNAVILQKPDGKNIFSVVFNATDFKPNSSSPYGVSIYSMNFPQVRDEQSFFVFEAPPLIPRADYTYNGISPNRNITSLQVWVFGPSFAEESTVDVKPDGTFTFLLDHDKTRQVIPNSKNSPNYKMILHFPSADNQYDLSYNSDTGWLVDRAGKKCFDISQVRTLGGDDGSKLFIESIHQAGNHDTYQAIDLVVNDPWVSIDPVGERSNTINFTITGSTNTPAGNEILVEVYDIKYRNKALWSQCGKIPGEFSYVRTLKIMQGPFGKNVWQMPIPTNGWGPGTYVIYVATIYQNVVVEQTFNLTKGTVV